MSAENVYDEWTWNAARKEWVSPNCPLAVTKVATNIVGRRVRGKFWVDATAVTGILIGPYDSWESAVWAAEKLSA